MFYASSSPVPPPPPQKKRWLYQEQWTCRICSSHFKGCGGVYEEPFLDCGVLRKLYPMEVPHKHGNSLIPNILIPLPSAE
jgi:hypothetical protein